MAMFRYNKRKNGNGVIMSLIGMGIGAAAYGMMKKRNNNNKMMEPIKDAMNQMNDPLN